MIFNNISFIYSANSIPFSDLPFSIPDDRFDLILLWGIKS